MIVQMKRYKPVKDFCAGVSIAFSSAEDGCMPFGGGAESTNEQKEAVYRFLRKYGFDTAHVVKVGVLYEPTSTFTHIERADSTSAWDTKADAIFTTDKQATIILPVADCVATVVYDPVVEMVGVLHLGRHSSVAGLIEEFAIRVADELGSDPHDWHVWMSPSLQAESNVLDYFEPPYPEKWEGYMRPGKDGMIHIDMPGHNRNCLERIGVPQENIYTNAVDTYTDKHFFSHRAATEDGDTTRQGRMIVAAAMAKK